MTGIFSSTHEKTLDACYSINLNSHLVPIISMTRNIRFRTRSKSVDFWTRLFCLFDLIQGWDSHTLHVRNIHIKTILKHLLILPGGVKSMAKELFVQCDFWTRNGHFEVILGVELKIEQWKMSMWKNEILNIFQIIQSDSVFLTVFWLIQKSNAAVELFTFHCLWTVQMVSLLPLAPLTLYRHPLLLRLELKWNSSIENVFIFGTSFLYITDYGNIWLQVILITCILYNARLPNLQFQSVFV